MTHAAALTFLKKNIDPKDDSQVFLILHNGKLWWHRVNSKTSIPCTTIYQEEQLNNQHAVNLYGEDLKLIWLSSWGTSLETQIAAERFYFTVEWTKDGGDGEDRQYLPVFYHSGSLETFLGPNSDVYREYLRLIDEPPMPEEIAALEA